MIVLWGIFREVVPLVRELVRAIREGNQEEAIVAAQRAAELQAFRLYQKRKRGEA